MEIETVFGVKWRIPTLYDISLIILIVLILVFILVILKYYMKSREKQAHLYQLLLFKANQLGLTNYQIKILNSIAGLSKNKNPNAIYSNPLFFESSIGKFLVFLNTQNEQVESLNRIYKDIMVIYEKLYHPSKFKKPLENIAELEAGQILYFSIRKTNYYLGKITKIENNYIRIKLFNIERSNKDIAENNEIQVYLWRTGDAEYTFISSITAASKNTIAITVPETYTRGEEVRPPSIGVDLPCIISFNPHLAEDDTDTEEEQKKNIKYDEIEASVIKLNIDEALIMIDQELLYDYEYFLNFELDGFKVKIVTVVMAKKTLKDSNLNYYTLKFKDITDASKEVIHKFIIENLH
ncbi:MAG: hypothetical protein JW864_15795 [Spirochaetes bacterium]|nr:hypothetical protein [Spirochaetota bacterium]